MQPPDLQPKAGRPRKTYDYAPSMINWLQTRSYQRDWRDRPALLPHSSYARDVRPIAPRLLRAFNNSAMAVCRCFQLLLRQRHHLIVIVRAICIRASTRRAARLILWHLLLTNNGLSRAHRRASLPLVSTRITKCWREMIGSTIFTGFSSTFNFDTLMQAHKTAVRCLRWASNGEWMLTGDNNGFVKQWRPNLAAYDEVRAHGSDENPQAIRGLRQSH
jgi:polyadenylation factor subunit 2